MSRRPRPDSRSESAAPFDVEPGEYDVFIAVREKAKDGLDAGGVAQDRHPEAVRHGAGLRRNELTTSSVIVAEKVDVLAAPLSNDHQAENPYTFGQVKMTPSLTNKFTKKDDLNVFFWIYGEQMDPATKKPNMTVDFNFSQKLPEAARSSSTSTEPQELNASTLPPTLDFSAGRIRCRAACRCRSPASPRATTISRSRWWTRCRASRCTRDVTFTVAPSAVQ